MKRLHRKDMMCWSTFDCARNMDFNAYLWLRDEGNIVFDPLPLSEHDWSELETFGGAAWVVVSNSDHCRAAHEIAAAFGAQIAGPRGERDTFPIECQRWIGEHEPFAAGMRVFELEGSKTPGELAFLIDNHTLITGDLLRAPEGGRLELLPDAKLQDIEQAKHSLRRLLDYPSIQAVLVGDGWPLFREGYARLWELLGAG